MNDQAPLGINVQPYEVRDFSGGITDYYLDCPSNKYKRCDNLVLVSHGDTAKPFTRQGSQIYDATYNQIPAGNQRIGLLKLFESTLLVQSKEKIQYVSSGWQTLQGPSGNNVFPSTASTTAVVSTAVWNHHLLVASDGFFKPQKIYPNASNTLTLRTAGLPALASTPTVTAGAAGTGSYIYAFVYYYTYQVGTLTYEDYGPVTIKEVTSAAAPNASAISIASIPALANGATDNYDTASSSLKVKIYRTIDGGQTFYYEGSVNNGTTTFSSTTSDTTLEDNGILLYTEGGAVENEPPPLCKLVHVSGNLAAYAHLKIGTEIRSNRMVQSVPGDIDAVPSDFYCEVEDEIVGLSSVKGSWILLCRRFPYRVDGAIDVFGNGDLLPQKLSESAGCISAKSVVQTQEGVFWASLDGIYFTDGYNVIRLNEDYNKTWATWVSTTAQQQAIEGKYDPLNRRIWWTIQSGTGVSDDCDLCYVLDLNEYGGQAAIRRKATFTTMSGTNDSFAPTALEFSLDTMYRADRRGYLFTHQDGLYTDPKVDVGVSPASWETTLLRYDFISGATSFGTTMARKFIPRVDVVADNETNLSMQIVSINDDSTSGYDLKPIRSRGNMTWGDPDVLWGDAGLVWNRGGIIDEERRFPGRALRCQFKQVRMTNAYVAIVSSDVLGTADVDATLKTVTLTNAATVDWLTTIVDYYIAFEGDAYTREFLITERTSDDVITISDSSNLLSTVAGSKWVIRGYPRGEVLNLISYTIHYSIFGGNKGLYQKSESGEVGA
jgi:hypothetical protein